MIQRKKHWKAHNYWASIKTILIDTLQTAKFNVKKSEIALFHTELRYFLLE